MEKETLSINIDPEIHRALDIYLSKNGRGSLAKELEKRLGELYDEAVPEPVREYIGMRFRPTVTRSRPKKTVKVPEAEGRSAPPVAEPVAMPEPPQELQDRRTDMDSAIENTNEVIDCGTIR